MGNHKHTTDDFDEELGHAIKEYLGSLKPPPGFHERIAHTLRNLPPRPSRLQRGLRVLKIVAVVLAGLLVLSSAAVLAGGPRLSLAGRLGLARITAPVRILLEGERSIDSPLPAPSPIAAPDAATTFSLPGFLPERFDPNPILQVYPTARAPVLVLTYRTRDTGQIGLRLAQAPATDPPLLALPGGNSEPIPPGTRILEKGEIELGSGVRAAFVVTSYQPPGTDRSVKSLYVLWQQDGRVYLLEGSISLEEATLIARSIGPDRQNR